VAHDDSQNRNAKHQTIDDEDEAGAALDDGAGYGNFYGLNSLDFQVTSE
jgi:hypothetical protein